MMKSASKADNGGHLQWKVLHRNREFEFDAGARLKWVGDHAPDSAFADIASASEHGFTIGVGDDNFQTLVQIKAGRLAAIPFFDFVHRIGWPEYFERGQHRDLVGKFATEMGDLELLVKGEYVKQQHHGQKCP